MHRTRLLTALACLALTAAPATRHTQNPLPFDQLAHAHGASPGPARFGVRYGDDAPAFQVLNLYLTAGARDLVLWIPGGWGQQPLPTTEPDPASFLGQLRAEGFHVGELSVRPSSNPGGPEWYWPAPQDDVALAVAFLRAHPERFGVPFRTVSVVGRSAGGVRVLGAELSDPGDRLFDAIAEISACTDLTQLAPAGSVAAPYFGATQNAEVPPADFRGASAVPLILDRGLGVAPPIYLQSPNASQVPSNPHAAYYQVLLDTLLDGLGHPHRFAWTPGQEVDAHDLAAWLRRVLR